MENKQDKKFTIVTQTKVAFLGYALLLTSLVLLALWQQPASVLPFLSYIFIFILTALLSLYILNCTVTGNCITYSWFAAYFVVAIAVFGSLSMLAGVFRH